MVKRIVLKEGYQYYRRENQLFFRKTIASDEMLFRLESINRKTQSKKIFEAGKFLLFGSTLQLVKSSVNGKF